MELDVSIVIPNWNGLGIIEDCLSSIKNSVQTVSYEVIVVDNNSTDGSAEVILKEYSWVTFARLPVNKGFASACNVGMELSQGRYIWILNADTEVRNHTLDEMVKFMDENPKVGALNPKVVYPDGTLQPSVMYLSSFLDALWEEIFWHTHLHRWFKKEYRKKAHVKGIDYNNTLEMEWLRGSCLFIRREVYKQIGGFDSNFFFGYEEHDYSIRIRQLGWRLVWMPKAEIVHKASSVGSRFGKRLVIWLNNSNFYFWRKHKGLIAEILLRVTISGNQFLRVAVLFLLAFLLRKEWAKERLMDDFEILRWSLWGRPNLPEATDSNIWQRIKQGGDSGTHGFFEAIIPPDINLIDLGCNDGILAKKLIAKGVKKILGIVVNKNAIALAQKIYAEDKASFLVADIERLPFKSEVGECFDGVLLADVLEHLESPKELLKNLSQMFVINGKLRRAFISIPNIAYWEIRLQLLKGRFEYQDGGIMDRTHRWFFTLNTFKKLIKDSDWNILRILPVPGNKGKDLRGKISLFLTKLLPTLFGYQFIFECFPNQVFIRTTKEESRKNQN
ncbi:MAG: glycosyltransferase [Elusimicrobiota bacterium]